MKIALLSAIALSAMNNKISAFKSNSLNLNQGERPFEEAIKLHDKNKRKHKHKQKRKK